MPGAEDQRRDEGQADGQQSPRQEPQAELGLNRNRTKVFDVAMAMNIMNITSTMNRSKFTEKNIIMMINPIAMPMLLDTNFWPGLGSRKKDLEDQ